MDSRKDIGIEMSLDTQKAKDIFNAYNITEAEEHLIFQMIALVQLLGFSKKLTVKIMQASSALIEAFMKEDKD